MLAFIDESGDPGLKVIAGSSTTFTIGMVLFEDYSEAAACDQVISNLRKELGWDARSEFHFSRNADRIRLKFLSTIAHFEFFSLAIVIRKDIPALQRAGFFRTESLYKYACGLLFEMAKPYLSNASVILDDGRNTEYKKYLASYFRKRIHSNQAPRHVRSVQMLGSQSSNLLQLVDYIVGAVSRSVRNGLQHQDRFRSIVSHREIETRIWP